MSLVVLLNGFFLNITTVPVYLVWMVYISFFYWATEALFISEWGEVGSLECPANSTGTSKCYLDGEDVLASYGFGTTSKLPLNFGILIALVLFWRSIALFTLYLRSYGSVWRGNLRKMLWKNQ